MHLEPPQAESPVLNWCRVGAASRHQPRRCRDRLWRRLCYASGFHAVATLQAAAFANSVLETNGPAASAIADLWWLMFTVAVIVVLIVLALYLFAITTGKRADSSSPAWSNSFIVIGGIIVPAFILLGVLIYSFSATAALSGPEGDALIIEVVGHQWWWEVRYPQHDIVTANEIHIPLDEPVRLELSSVDVIHSLWVPSLNGKMDLVPGQVNTLWIEADQAGIYRGSCAEYCGTQHANMGLLVIADPAATFAAWTDEQVLSAQAPATRAQEKGLEVFLSSACVNCHTVSGTNASGNLGPDLTHLASRMTLGAGSIANNHGNLAGWIVNSQAIKPGNRMPPMYLESSDLHYLLSYLRSLE